jgi:hypothetical protein
MASRWIKTRRGIKNSASRAPMRIWAVGLY